jgi:hypothetical protein
MERIGFAGHVKRLLPWLGTVVLLGYLAWTTDLKAVASAVAEVNILAALAVALGGTAATFFTDVWCVSLAFKRFVCRVSYREALPIKATSYFLNVLNYNVALIGMAFYLQRSRNAPFWKALGSMFFLNVMDILALCILLAAGLAINQGDGRIDPGVELVAWLLSAGGLAGFLLLVAVCKWGRPLPLLKRLLSLELLAPLAELDLVTSVRFVALRIAFLLQYLFSQYCFLRLFGIEAPLTVLFVYLPLLTFIQIIPISISGLGTTQIAMRHFYAPYVVTTGLAASGVIDAFSTTAIFGFVFFRLAVAYLFLGELSREVIRKAGDKLPAKEG